MRGDTIDRTSFFVDLKEKLLKLRENSLNLLLLLPNTFVICYSLYTGSTIYSERYCLLSARVNAAFNIIFYSARLT